MSNYKKELVLAIANKIKSAGYKVFLAEKGTYGFFTDEKGSRVVSFQNDYLHISFGGNYVTNNPRQCGQGWRMDGEWQPDITKSQINMLFNSGAPQWATNGNNWKFKTLEQHVKQYGSSSNYKEL